MAEKVMPKRWFRATCPLPLDCTDECWKRKRKCESYESDEDCREKVLLRLRWSSLHKDCKDPEEVVKNMEVQCEDAPWLVADVAEHLF